MKINFLQIKLIITITLLLSSLVSLSFGSYVASDPTNMSTGARALSLGNASAAINQDVSSIYTNPAALAVASNWQIASMSGKEKF